MSPNRIGQVFVVAVGGAAGSLLTLLAVGMWAWMTEGALVQGLGGATRAQLAETAAAMEARLASLSLPAGAIVLTDGECKALGPHWKRYEGLDGRFPLGAGQTEDDRGESRPFVPGAVGGAYQHQLTVPEMPSHTHHYPGSHGSRSVDDWDNEWAHRDRREETEPRGGNKPHNNMPPYLVLNFCHKTERPS